MRTILLSIVTLFAVATPAVANPSAEKSVGLGVGVGIATGPNLQLASSRAGQLDIGFGYQIDDRLRVQTDYAWRLIDLSGAHSVALPLYLGVGGFLTDHRWGYNDAGLRMPIGLQADFARAPIQVFGEVSPELVLVQIYDRNMEPPPAAGTLALTGLMGVRAAF
jgi:hypothetical protein